jgi:serine/threonine-protein kinase
MAYVHGQGVIHRDLKPTNIMLGDFGETLVVDWGVAKVIGPGASASDEETHADEVESRNTEPLPCRPGWSITMEGQVVGTPGYMSPEQAGGKAGELGPSSDLYSLGATLYAILTGRAPFEGPWEEVRRRIKRGEFVLPRQVRPGVPAALAAICEKAMALRPESRYTSVLELAAELECWLADRPVSAYPEPWSEHVRRWVRRHQAGVSGAAAAVAIGFLALGLTLPVISFAWRNEARARQREAAQRNLAMASAASAEAERDRAEAALKFLVDAFRKPDPAQDGRSVKVVELLDRAAHELETRFADSPLTRAALLQAIGETYQGLGLPRESLAAFQRVADLRREVLGEADPATLEAKSLLAAALQDSGQVEQAINLYESVLAGRKDVLGEEHADTLETTNDLAVAYWEAGDATRAIPLYESVLKRERERLGEDHADTLTVMDNLAVAYAAAGEPARAISLHEVVLERLRKTLGDEHPTTLITMNNLARAFELNQKHDQAIALYETTLEKIRPRLSADHPHTLTLLHGLAEATMGAGRRDRAVAIYEDVLTRRRAALGADHPDTLKTAAGLVKARLGGGELDRALAVAETFLKPGKLRPPAPVRKELREATRMLAESLERAGRTAAATDYRNRLATLEDTASRSQSEAREATP